MEDRKAELERKKEKLRQIREERKKKEEMKRLNVVVSDADILQTGENSVKENSVSGGDSPLSITLEHPDPLHHTLYASTNGRIKKNLEVSEIVEIVIPPPEAIAYNKEVQTTLEYNERENRSTDYYVLTYDEVGRDAVDANAALAELEKMPHVGLTKSGVAHKSSSKLDNRQLLLNETNEKLLCVENSTSEAPLLTEEEKRQLLTSDGFLRFLERSSRVIEKALHHSKRENSHDYPDEGENKEKEKTDVHINITHEYYNERWTKHRTVTGLDWSTLFPELLLSAYRLNEDTAHGHEGVCLLWNMKYPDRCTPEYIFYCRSPVTSASLSRFHPNIVVAGTYSGQIVLWDSRINKRTPVQHSPLTSWAHTHPVFAITLVGTENAHNIISMGSDGSLCAWSLEMLSQPREKTKVCDSSSSSLFELYPTCMSFFANDVNNYVVGTENGNAYCGQRHSSRTGVSEEVPRHAPYKGHGAPLTAVSTHPCPGTVNFSPLFLTSSLDWTVCLWSTREHKPLYTFEDYSDYVYDVCWSTVHPAVFAAVDGTGRLDIWNVNQNTELPSARILIGATDNTSFTSSGAALNKCRWNNNGAYIATGDDSGRVFVCSVHESLSQPHPEDWSRFAHTLTDLKQYDTEPDTKTTR